MPHALEAFPRLCINALPKTASNNLVVMCLLRPSFKLCQLAVKKDAVPMIFNFTMERCKPAIGQKTTTNKRIMPAEQRANSSAISQVK